METFRIYEKQSQRDTREGYTIGAKTLSQAKRHATSRQAFYGTVLVIESENGRVLAVKGKDGKWSEPND